MTDELDRLTAALRVTPSPDPAAKAMALSQAMESFDRPKDFLMACVPCPMPPGGRGAGREFTSC
jgi:hypothetical protein